MGTRQAERIVTCCYCGGRSILPERKIGRLVCHGCGAPISRIQRLEAPPGQKAKGKKRRKAAIPYGADRKEHLRPKDRPLRRKKGKRRKSTLERFWKEIEDAFEDIFD
ncbi:MAG: hypothetical protein AAF577_12010 [Pseudomonadota bacterium]